MPAPFSQNFEQKIIESDLKVLAEEIRKHREKSENADLGEKELLKEAIRSVPVPSPSDDDSSAPAQLVPPSKGPLPSYAQNAPAQTKLEIEYLLDVALRQGIAKANAEAKKSPPFVLDAFHDVLAGKLYPELKKRGLVK